jgi:hypothetical protein
MENVAQKETAYRRYCKLQYELSKEELAKIFGPGEVTKTKPGELVLEDWAPIVELATGEKTGYTTRVKGRPLEEIYKKVISRIEDNGLIIDEYATISSDARLEHKLEEWPDDVSRIMCYAVRGGSEGHYVHVDVVVSKPYEKPEVIGIFLIKTFLGMDHALRLSNVLTQIFDDC